MWLHRNELSRDEKRQRALYLSLRDELDYHLIEYALVEPYFEFLKSNTDYPFVNKRELKPRAKVVEEENSMMNGFIIIFTEDALPSDLKKNIRFFDTNKVTKENLGELKLTGLNPSDRFQKQQKYLEGKRFYDLLKSLLNVDYALLIQKDTTIRNKNRFALSHFHVRIDYLLDTAAELLGKELRYISKELYEKGDTYALSMVEKLFEYYSFHHSVSGRRTAAMLAAQLLRQVDFYNTVYVSSTESRTLTKLYERGTCKYSLVRLTRDEIKNIEEHSNGDPDFRKKYLVHDAAKFGVAVLQIVYTLNENSKYPMDGKLRELKPDLSWLRIRNQLLMPRVEEHGTRPIRYQVVYDQTDPLA